MYSILETNSNFLKKKKSHGNSRTLKAVIFDSNPTDFLPSRSRLFNTSGLQTPHLQNEDNNKGDEGGEMMMVMMKMIMTKKNRLDR